MEDDVGDDAGSDLTDRLAGGPTDMKQVVVGTALDGGAACLQAESDRTTRFAGDACEDAASGGRRVTDYSFSFVDLAGFTAATWVHGDVAGADLAEQFADLAARATGGDDRVVKSIGDAVMCVSPTPSQALRMVSRLFAITGAVTEFPLLRAGIHHGPAEERRGDYFGTAVNVAARVAALAQPGELFVTEPIIAAARQLELATTDYGERALRNVGEPVRIFRVALGCCDPEAIVDPVCQMRIDPSSAHASHDHRGVTYWLCSPECLREFAANPGRFVGETPDEPG